MNIKLTSEQMKELRMEKAAYQAHVALVMVQDDCPKPLAEFKAYKEGSDGLNKRMAPPVQGELLGKKNA